MNKHSAHPGACQEPPGFASAYAELQTRVHAAMHPSSETSLGLPLQLTKATAYPVLHACLSCDMQVMNTTASMQPCSTFDVMPSHQP